LQDPHTDRKRLATIKDKMHFRGEYICARGRFLHDWQCTVTTL